MPAPSVPMNLGTLSYGSMAVQVILQSVQLHTSGLPLHWQNLHSIVQPSASAEGAARTTNPATKAMRRTLLRTPVALRICCSLLLEW